MAIPFFILAGNFLTHGGVARRMINFATSMVGHWYGGLGLAGVMACALFAAVSGSSPATVIAIGSIMLPAMVRQGFPKRFGAGVITTSGALGILIPPSIVMVIYAWRRAAASRSILPDAPRSSSRLGIRIDVSCTYVQLVSCRPRVGEHDYRNTPPEHCRPRRRRVPERSSATLPPVATQ